MYTSFVDFVEILWNSFVGEGLAPPEANVFLYQMSNGYTSAYTSMILREGQAPPLRSSDINLQLAELELAIDDGRLTSCEIAERMAGFPRNVIISWEPFQF